MTQTLTLPLKPGDVVRLKSGGPPMTVNALEDRRFVWTIWFDHGRQGAARFDRDALTLYQRPAPDARAAETETGGA